VDGEGSTVSQTTAVADNTDTSVATTSTKMSGSSTAARIVWFVAGVVLTLLAFRFVLILLGAVSSNPFAHFIYSVSYPFAAPFFGLFGYELRYGVSRLEISTLVAMAVYALVAYGIARLVTIRQPRQNV
jgi:uncharacterized protein YggT (Ycf19 family)